MSSDGSNKKLIPTSGDDEVQSWISLSTVDAATQDDDVIVSPSLRPNSFSEYVGQDRICENITIACGAARNRGEALDHVLLHGPPGLGKTSLAKILSKELGVGFKSTSGPVIERPGDLAAILTALEANDVLFIDEIHRLPRVVEEVLYPAMEDYELDILIGQGPAAKSVKIDIKPFTLVGATTRSGLLTSPLRDRFGLHYRLQYYSNEELAKIITRSANILSLEIGADAARQIASRSRGTPRIANRLLRRARDYAQEKNAGEMSVEAISAALDLLDVDTKGLTGMDRMLLQIIINKLSGGLVGVDTISAALGEEKDTIEEVYEPYLIQQGYLARTKRGREVTELAYNHCGRDYSLKS